MSEGMGGGGDYVLPSKAFDGGSFARVGLCWAGLGNTARRLAD